MVSQPLINVSHCSLRGVCIHCIQSVSEGKHQYLEKQTWRHMAQNLGPIESHPVKGGMWENVTVHAQQLRRGEKIEKTYILFLYERDDKSKLKTEKAGSYQDNFWVKKYFIPNS